MVEEGGGHEGLSRPLTAGAILSENTRPMPSFSDDHDDRPADPAAVVQSLLAAAKRSLQEEQRAEAITSLRAALELS